MHCKYCSDFDYEQLEAGTYMHHESFNHLLKSADEGCAICKLVVANPDQSEGPVLQDSQLKCSLTNWSFAVTSSINWFVEHGETRRPVATLHICVDEDDKFSNIVEFRPVWKSPLSYRCSLMIRKWFARCHESHTTCPRLEDKPLPTRVIDVGIVTTLDLESEVRPHKVRIIEGIGKSGQWTALSHCWGGAMLMKLELGNYESRCAGIQIEDLPTTFKEAVIITRRLGIRYLWIDALCIIQDSPTDWKNEAEKMADVYSNATLTIAADASPDSMTGMVESSRASRDRENYRATTKWHNRESMGILRFRIAGHENAARGPLSTRCWTLQEDILSPRVLFYLEHEVKWKCAEILCSEIYPSKNGYNWSASSVGFARPWNHWNFLNQKYPGSKLSRFKGQKILDYWYQDIVNTYARREITFETDKLIAILGIASKIKQDFSEFQLVAGLWQNDIHRGLDWSHWSTPGGSLTKHKPYIAPSWSWAQYKFIGGAPYDKDTARFGSFGPRGQITAIEEHHRKWRLTLTSQCWKLCSCKTPGEFLDQGTDPNCSLAMRMSDSSHSATFVHYSVRYEPNVEWKEYLKGLRMQAIMTQSSCNVARSEAHKDYYYVQFGRWDSSNPDPTRPAFKHSGPLLVALILEQTDDLTNTYCRVGRAYIPLPEYRLKVDNELPEWPVKTFTVV